ncbi:hypothetical protein Pelo_16871 [Pelomyxa schiedti]|nr:hypothetical protein Pelo_16871 [Pelomyxa schiedti]
MAMDIQMMPAGPAELPSSLDQSTTEQDDNQAQVQVHHSQFNAKTQDENSIEEATLVTRKNPNNTSSPTAATTNTSAHPDKKAPTTHTQTNYKYVQFTGKLQGEFLCCATAHSPQNSVKGITHPPTVVKPTAKPTPAQDKPRAALQVKEKEQALCDIEAVMHELLRHSYLMNQVNMKSHRAQSNTSGVSKKMLSNFGNCVPNIIVEQRCVKCS